MNKWRLIDSKLRPAAVNMALDKVLLDSRNSGEAPNTLLFLEFNPCALVGYHQSVELEVEEAYCRTHRIEINRRISGGGAIYMDGGALGWAIFAGKDTPGISNNLDDMYKELCNSVAIGLSKLGVKAKYRPKNDIEVNGRKISGSGGTQHGDAFLYHGTVLVDFDVDAMISCLKLPIKKLEDKQVKSFRERVVTLQEILGEVPDLRVVKDAVRDGFSDVFGIEFTKADLTSEELSSLERESMIFRSDNWIRGGRSSSQESELRISDYKAPGGLIRVSILLDPQRQRIKSAFITGDFFAYPQQCILDLESFLRNTSSVKSDVFENVRLFFKYQNVQILGVDADHMGEAVCQAIAGVTT